MNKLIFLLFSAIPWAGTCRPPGDGGGDSDSEDSKNKTKDEGRKRDKFFPSADSWGGWSPKEGDESWKDWIEKWGKYRSTKKPDSAEWNRQRGPGSGWPQHWAGYGEGIGGVPPPPWAYLPASFADKPEFCFQFPRFGYCDNNLTRWAFNPTTGKCQIFFYSGCGGSDNNFMSEVRCNAACVDDIDSDANCESDPSDNFDYLMNPKLGPKYEHRPPHH